jgi:hypothetical protein
MSPYLLIIMSDLRNRLNPVVTHVTYIFKDNSTESFSFCLYNSQKVPIKKAFRGMSWPSSSGLLVVTLAILREDLFKIKLGKNIEIKKKLKGCTMVLHSLRNW